MKQIIMLVSFINSDSWNTPFNSASFSIGQVYEMSTANADFFIAKGVAVAAPAGLNDEKLPLIIRRKPIVMN